MKLYSYWRSSSAWRVRTVLHVKGIAFEQGVVNLGPEARAHDTVAFEAVNAMRQIPVLEWNEAGRTLRLTQSVAIAEYLEQTHPTPPLLPVDLLLRARVREAVEIVCSGIQPLQNLGVLNRLRSLGGEAAATGWASEAIGLGLAALELHACAHGRGFSVGDQLSLADVFLVPQLYNARRYGVDLTGFPTLVAIDARLSALPAFALAHPDRQPDAPRT